MNLNRLILCAPLLLIGCGTTQQMAPRFVQPSTAPIAKANAAIAQKHVEIKEHVQATEKDLTQILDTCPQAKAIVDSAQLELQKAYDAVGEADADRAMAEGARDALDAQLKSQTAQCNTVAANYDKAGAQITSLQQSRHKWVVHFWEVTGLLALAGVWIFKGPLLGLIKMIPLAGI